MLNLLLLNLAVIVVLVVVLWMISLAIRDVSIVDIFWGLGYVVVAWVSLAYWLMGEAAEMKVRLLLICSLVTIWGLRLSLYLFWRNHGQPEDARYATMREKHGVNFWWVSFLTVFMLQALLMWFISFPIQFVAAAQIDPPVGWLDIAGVLIWLIGWLFETIGDWQLARFRSEPSNAGKVLDKGLWRYTRHPNYFGDFCVWWGIFLISISGGGTAAILSPILMSFLLLRVSGVTLTEKTISQRRPDYEAYKKRTSSFFPWWPKQSEA